MKATAFVGDGSGLTNLPGGGDITAVNAGTGLTGGATSGDATLTFDTASGNTYGVRGESLSASGTGVHGNATGTGVYGTGATGVYGVSNSASGRGVIGWATATSVGVTYGIYGQSDNEGGRLWLRLVARGAQFWRGWPEQQH